MGNKLSRLKERVKQAGRRKRSDIRPAAQRTKSKTKEGLQRARAAAVASYRNLQMEELKKMQNSEKQPAERAADTAQMGPPIDATLEPTSGIQHMDQLATSGSGQQPMGDDQPAQRLGEPTGPADGVEPMDSFASLGMGFGQVDVPEDDGQDFESFVTGGFGDVEGEDDVEDYGLSFDGGFFDDG